MAKEILPEITRILNILEEWQQGQQIGKPTLSKLPLPITTGGPKDIINCAPLAGKYLLSIACIVGSESKSFTEISGFEFTAADDNDALFLWGAINGEFGTVFAWFNFPDGKCTGIGSSIEVDPGIISACYAFIVTYPS